ncbi:substrate-binding domain-containing protein, partial [Streptomyces fimicarius]
RHMHPPLTSVRQPIEEMGRRMAQLLLDEIAGRAPGDERPSVVLPTELVVRDSS